MLFLDLKLVLSAYTCCNTTETIVKLEENHANLSQLSVLPTYLLENLSYIIKMHFECFNFCLKF